MGSLPNLHELSRDKPSAGSSPLQFRATGTAAAGLHQHQHQHPQPPHQQLQQQQGLSGSKHHVHQTGVHTNSHHTHKRARSGGAHHHVHGTTQAAGVWDNDAMLEQQQQQQHMSQYSPISWRSTRASALSWRRRDSLSSSAGASSVRRLIAAVRSAPAGPRPPKKALLRHCAALLLGHASWAAAALPFFPLQSGLGAFEPSLGPLLPALLFGVAALASCIAPIITHKLGCNVVICLGHVITMLFVGAHFYPRWYVLLPSYALMGAWTSPSFIARASSVNVSAANLGLVCSDPEDPDETRRDCILRRLNRGIKLAEDLGLAIGCLVAAAMLRATFQEASSLTTSTSDMSELEIEQWCGAEYMAPDQLYLLAGLEISSSSASNDSKTPPISQSTVTIANSASAVFTTSTIEESVSPASELDPDAARLMLSAWLGLATLAFGLSCALLDGRVRDGGGQTAHERAAVQPGALLAQVRAAFYDPRMQLAAPLTLFIGLEQGFIFADFTEAYVVCALGGADKVALSFLSLGLLQALAGVTLSMLMRHIRRYLAVVVGFAFHACLILVLVTWRPAGDDPALFHVISAAWGVCNAIWETLIYTLLVALHPGSRWEGPLSVSLFWRWLGLGLALGSHGLVRTRIRCFGLAGMLLLGVVPYGYLELKLARRGCSGKSLAPL